MSTVEKLIQELDLSPHPEGGFFKENYRAQASLQNGRSVATGIYFLLTGKQFSAFHRIDADEMWHFYAASPQTSLNIWCIDPLGDLECKRLGSELEHGENYQLYVPAGTWFAAELNTPKGLEQEAYVLSGCTVAPAFEFSHFELADYKDLSKHFPQHQEILARLCLEKA